MNILFIHNQTITAGKANAIQVSHMCEAYSEIGNRVTLLIPKSDNSIRNIYDAASQILGNEPSFQIEEFTRYSLFGKLKTLGAILGVNNFLKLNNKYDVAILRYASYSIVLNKYRIPFIFEAHQIKLNNNSRVIDKWMTSALLKSVKKGTLIRFVCLTNILSEYWQKKGIPSSKIIIAADAVDKESFNIKESKEELRSGFEMHKTRPVVMYAGRIEKNRNISSIVKLAQHFTEVDFHILGGPDSEADIYREKTSDVKNIFFRGNIPHNKVKKYLFAADILLMIWGKNVQHLEGFSPLKMFEYMASGRLIVGHNYKAIQEVLTNGENAILVEPENEKALFDGLKEALSNEESSIMGSKAKSLAQEYYTWDKRATKILSDIL